MSNNVTIGNGDWKITLVIVCLVILFWNFDKPNGEDYEYDLYDLIYHQYETNYHQYETKEK